MGYDAAGRRIWKAIGDTSLGLRSTGMDDCTYHYYLSGNSVVEERNGSDQPIKDHVWGLTYVDEAVQTRVNTNLSSPSWTNYYHLQDANFNDLGMLNASGTLVERYEYAAYGQRQVFTSAGSNDPGCYTPIFASKKVTIGSVSQPWGLNEVGHQGLLHDEQSGIVYNRARMLQPTLGRFMQVDPLGYVDSMNFYAYVRYNSISKSDPTGKQSTSPGTRPAPIPLDPTIPADCEECPCKKIGSDCKIEVQFLGNDDAVQVVNPMKPGTPAGPVRDPLQFAMEADYQITAAEKVIVKITHPTKDTRKCQLIQNVYDSWSGLNGNTFNPGQPTVDYSPEVSKDAWEYGGWWFYDYPYYKSYSGKVNQYFAQYRVFLEGSDLSVYWGFEGEVDFSTARQPPHVTKFGPQEKPKENPFVKKKK